jgi:hypothetical protein
LRTRALIGAALASTSFAGLAGSSTPLALQPTILDCGAQAVSPAELTLACGDGNYGLTEMRWTGWGTATATGTGSARASDCTPYCAAGHFHTYRVTATASRLRTCLDGRGQYTRLVLRYPGKRPQGASSPEIWKFPCDAPGPGPTLTAKALGGRRVDLSGSGWERSARCATTVALGFLGETSDKPFAHPKPGKGYSFHLVWKAPKTGRAVVIASQPCTSSLGARVYKRAIAVTVR